MKRESTFKYVFWALLVGMVLLLITVAGMVLPTITGMVQKLVLLLPLVLFLPAYIILVARLIYVDAARRGMDPWLWMTVAVFVPSMIGLIIYLIMRMSVSNTCINCGKGIQKDFKVCPYCGQNQEMVCENCQKTIARDWKVCPNCGHSLSRGEDQN
jgi:RNA polymerase subunit RPABC4/transcription elongation factor Spt4